MNEVKQFLPYIGVIPGCAGEALGSPYDMYEPCMGECGDEDGYVRSTDYNTLEAKNQ